MKRLFFYTFFSVLIAISLNVYGQDTYRIEKIYNAQSIIIGQSGKIAGEEFKSTDKITFPSDRVMLKAHKIGTSEYYFFNKAILDAKKAKTLKEYFANNYAKVKGSGRVVFDGNVPTISYGEVNKTKFPEKRIALLIGNGNYANYERLPNALNDVRDVSVKLKKLGFDVMTLYDADDNDMNSSITSFLKEAKSYEVALIYFAGHGYRKDGKEYLLSVSCDKKGTTAISTLNSLVDQRDKLGGDKLFIFVIDACRNQSIFDDNQSDIAVKRGTILFRSTLSGEIAKDEGDEVGNSPFAKSFINIIGEKGKSVGEEFYDVVRDVRSKTNNKQVPVLSISDDYDFFFCKSDSKTGKADTSSSKVYRSFVSIGGKALRERRFSDALASFEGAMQINDSEETARLIKTVNDSIDSVYYRATRLYRRTGRQNKEKAIELFSQLQNTRRESLAYLGSCYEIIGKNDLAKKYYEDGVKKNDAQAIYWYADYLVKKEFSSSTRRRINLYKRVWSSYTNAIDSLGIEYERFGMKDSAYYWYSKSTSNFSKYNRASLLLDSQNSNKLTGVTEDPLKLLEEVANNTSGSDKTICAQAAYYLGLFYLLNRSKVKGDSDGVRGWKWIERAAQMGHSDAKGIVNHKNDYRL